MGRRWAMSIVISTAVASSLAGVSRGRGHDEPDAGARSMPALAIRFYQSHLSDLRYGRCFFTPSCSAYALDATRSRGLLIGASLAADRLVRCSPAARAFHVVAANGRLVDPVDGDGDVIGRPGVPGWILPPVPEAPLDPERESGPGSSRSLDEEVAFAEALAADGDCWRATTEFKRIAFLSSDPRLAYWSRLRIGWCYYEHGEPDDAPSEFLEAALVAGDGPRRDQALFLAAAALFDAGRYRGCEEALAQIAGNPGEHAVPVRVLGGLNAMATGSWEAGAGRLRAAAERADRPEVRDRALLLAREAIAGRDLPRRSPTVAAVSSAVCPGLGQVYTGHRRDGFRHFVINGLLGYWLYRLIDDESYAGAFLVGSVELPFYLGNVLGARRSATQFNVSRRLHHVASAIRETE